MYTALLPHSALGALTGAITGALTDTLTGTLIETITGALTGPLRGRPCALAPLLPSSGTPEPGGVSERTLPGPLPSSTHLLGPRLLSGAADGAP